MYEIITLFIYRKYINDFLLKYSPILKRIDYNIH